MYSKSKSCFRVTFVCNCNAYIVLTARSVPVLIKHFADDAALDYIKLVIKILILLETMIKKYFDNA